MFVYYVYYVHLPFKIIIKENACSQRKCLQKVIHVTIYCALGSFTCFGRHSHLFYLVAQKSNYGVQDAVGTFFECLILKECPLNCSRYDDCICEDTFPNKLLLVQMLETSSVAGSSSRILVYCLQETALSQGEQTPDVDCSSLSPVPSCSKLSLHPHLFSVAIHFYNSIKDNIEMPLCLLWHHYLSLRMSVTYLLKFRNLQELSLLN